MNNDSLYLWEVHHLKNNFNNTMDNVHRLLNNSDPQIVQLLKLMLWSKWGVLWDAFGTQSTYYKFINTCDKKAPAGYYFQGTLIKRIDSICHFISYDMLDDGDPGLAWQFYDTKEGNRYCLSQEEMNKFKAAEPTQEIELAKVEQRWEDWINLQEKVFIFKPMITNCAELVSVDGRHCTVEQVIQTIQWHTKEEYRRYLDYLDFIDEPLVHKRDLTHPYLYDEPDKEEILIRQWMIANNIAPAKPCIE